MSKKTKKIKKPVIISKKAVKVRSRTKFLRRAKTKANLRREKINLGEKKVLSGSGLASSSSSQSGLISSRSKRDGQLPKTKIKVLGIGGGGNSIVSEIARFAFRSAPGVKDRIFKDIDFIAVNTDLQALAEVPKECKVLKFGQALTRGLGCGMNPELGKRAARVEKEKIQKILEGADFCILIACLGGGVGSGATPVVAEISRALKKISLGIFTMPFKFEGEKKKSIARNSLKKMKPNLNAVNVIPNEKIFQFIDSTKQTSVSESNLGTGAVPLKTAFSAVNQKLIFSLAGLIEMVYSPGLINIDWADFKTILEGKGRICYLNRAEARGENRAIAVAKSVVHNPLNEYGLEGIDRILFNIEGNKDLKMQEVDRISKFIFNFNKKAKVVFGVSLPSVSVKVGTKEAGSKIGITLLATGHPGTEKTSAKIRPEAKESSNFREKKEIGVKKQTAAPPVSKRTKGALRKKSSSAKIKRLFRKGWDGSPKAEKKSTTEQKPTVVKENQSSDQKVGSSSKAPSRQKNSLLLTKPRKKKTTRRTKESFLKKTIDAQRQNQQNQKKEKAKEETGEESLSQPERDNSFAGGKTIRKNALALKKDIEKAEKKILAEERRWDFPAFLRKDKKTI